MMSSDRSEDDKKVDAVFFANLDSLVPAQQIELTQLVIDKMFTVVKMVGDTVTLQLDPRFGDAVFDLVAEWKEFYDGDSYFNMEVWSRLPKNVQDLITDYIQKNLPGATFVDGIPSPDALRWLVENMPGKEPVTIVAKFFRVHGFMLAWFTNVFFKTLYRLAMDRQSLSRKSLALDTGTGFFACAMIYMIKFLLGFMFLFPPSSLVFGIAAVGGYAGSKMVKTYAGIEQ